MFQTFNMGMGFAVIVPAKFVDKVVDSLKKLRARIVGEVARGEGVLLADRNVRYKEY